MYKTIKNRLIKLAQIKKNSYKFASYNDLDIIITHIEKEYDKFFNSLF